MAIQTSRQLAISFRERAVTCENLAIEDVRPEDRAVLLTRSGRALSRLADKIDGPGARCGGFLRSYNYGLSSE
jgi:hypothetical protein